HRLCKTEIEGCGLSDTVSLRGHCRNKYQASGRTSPRIVAICGKSQMLSSRHIRFGAFAVTLTRAKALTSLAGQGKRSLAPCRLSARWLPVANSFGLRDAT